MNLRSRRSTEEEPAAEEDQASDAGASEDGGAPRLRKRRP
jgi:hypothetical protein